MYAHVDTISVACGHDCLQKIFQIVPQVLFRDSVVQRKEILEFLYGIVVAAVEIPADESLSPDDYRVYKFLFLGFGHGVLHLADFIQNVGRVVLCCRFSSENVHVKVCKSGIVEI